MKEQYYYVIASLPSLSLNDELPIRKDEFLSICEDNLETTDYEIFRSLDFNQMEQGKFSLDIINRFFNWERGMRNALVRLRAKKLGLNHDEFLRSEMFDHSLMLLAEEVFNAESPLMAEDILNKERWKHLDELEFGHYFDKEILAIFFIKLQILERISLFDEVRGLEKLNALVSQGVSFTD